MKVSRCIVEGFPSKDNDRYATMCEIVEDCNSAGISPPKEAVEYINRFDSGEEESAIQLRPGIDKGVSKRKYDDGIDAIIVDLREINEGIDIIRISHEEFEE
jgi:hypothetical protein